MKKRLNNYIITTIIALSVVVPLYAQNIQGKWDSIKEIERSFKPVLKQSDIEVFTQPSHIYVSVNVPVNVKIFTILGKLISSQDLEPGQYEYRLNTHGIYIIKTAESTCKVAI